MSNIGWATNYNNTINTEYFSRTVAIVKDHCQTTWGDMVSALHRRFHRFSDSSQQFFTKPQRTSIDFKLFNTIIIKI